MAQQIPDSLLHRPDETIPQWCRRRGWSVAKFYTEEKLGNTPRVLRVGNKAQITARADYEWEQAQYARAETREGKREAERRAKPRSMAGKLAAQSPDASFRQRQRKAAERARG